MKSIQVYSLQHAPCEDPGYILQWLEENQISHHAVRLFQNTPLPDPAVVDLLIIMGGPMNIYEETIYPWLIKEKIFIRKIIDDGKPVLGICLGAQLISSVLGGGVSRSPHPEYGWHKVLKVEEVSPAISGQTGKTGTDIFPDIITVFQWHQDTFQIPPGAVQIYYADKCKNQAFLHNSHVIGLQFHPEMDEPAIRGFLIQSRSELEEKGLGHLEEDIISQINLCSCGHGFISDMMKYLTNLVMDPKTDHTY